MNKVSEYKVITTTAEELTKLLNEGWFCEKLSTNIPLVGEVLITAVLSKSLFMVESEK